MENKKVKNKYSILRKNLTFSKALEALKDGEWIRCPEWRGYWFLEGGRIAVMTWKDEVIYTPWLEATILREDWQIVELNPEWVEYNRGLIFDFIHQNPQ